MPAASTSSDWIRSRPSCALRSTNKVSNCRRSLFFTCVFSCFTRRQAQRRGYSPPRLEGRVACIKAGLGGIHRMISAIPGVLVWERKVWMPGRFRNWWMENVEDGPAVFSTNDRRKAEAAKLLEEFHYRIHNTPAAQLAAVQ